MHDRGMLTIDGQAPLRETAYRLGPKGERWWELRQRAYVEFYVQENNPLCRQLLQRLPGAKGLKFDVRCHRWHHRICNFTGRLPLTWYRRSKEKVRLTKKRWRPCTRSACICHPDEPAFHPALASVVCFLVASSSVREGGLEKRVLALCE